MRQPPQQLRAQQPRAAPRLEDTANRQSRVYCERGDEPGTGANLAALATAVRGSK